LVPFKAPLTTAPSAAVAAAAVVEIEAALKDKNQTLMTVPTDLVPEIIKLINKKTARIGK
jgi:hypothetical protein